MSTKVWVGYDYKILDVSVSAPSDSLSVSTANSLGDYIGKSLLSTISGDETRMWLESLLQNVRFLNRPVTHSYRCDCNEAKRWCQMHVSPQRNASKILFEHSLLRVEANHATRMAPAIPARYAIRRCSICCRFEWQGHWLEPEDYAPIAKRSISELYDPRATHGVCPNCFGKIATHSFAGQ